MTIGDPIFDIAMTEFSTGKSFSVELILASTNPHYDKRLFIDLPPVLYTVAL